jgi:hypothetical protein
MTWEEKLKANLATFSDGRRTWSNEELALAYEIDNEANGLNNRDTGCSSCRRAVISRVRKLAERFK